MKNEKIVKEILLKEWDPIGIKDNSNAQTEYDAYALRIVGMLYNGTDEKSIFEYLKELVVDNFRLNFDKKLNEKISKKNFLFRQIIKNK